MYMKPPLPFLRNTITVANSVTLDFTWLSVPMQTFNSLPISFSLAIVALISSSIGRLITVPSNFLHCCFCSIIFFFYAFSNSNFFTRKPGLSDSAVIRTGLEPVTPDPDSGMLPLHHLTIFLQWRRLTVELTFDLVGPVRLELTALRLKAGYSSNWATNQFDQHNSLHFERHWMC